MIPTNVAIAMASFGSAAMFLACFLLLRPVFQRRRETHVAEEKRVEEWPEVLYLADPPVIGAARVPTREELHDLEMEYTRRVSVDILGRFYPPEPGDLLPARIHDGLDGAELVVVEPPPFPRRPRRGRLAANETATGPGWVGPTPAANTQEVA